MQVPCIPDLPKSGPNRQKKAIPFCRIWPLRRFAEDGIIAIPYAGITQIRFKGYLLSPNRHPLLFHFVLYSRRPAKSSPIPQHRQILVDMQGRSSYPPSPLTDGIADTGTKDPPQRLIDKTAERHVGERARRMSGPLPRGKEISPRFLKNHFVRRIKWNVLWFWLNPMGCSAA
jgi:hypothetical protein